MRFTSGLPKALSHLARDERGATAIEYALIAGLISIAAITAMSTMGNTLNDTFSNTNQLLQN